MQNGGFNQIVLVGDVSDAPKESGGKVRSAAFQLTTDRFWRDRVTHLERKSSQRHEVVAFEELRDVVMEYVKVGQVVLVVGTMQYYEHNKAFKAEVKADFIKIIKEP